MTAPVAVFTSPLAANKGIDTVLRAFALVRRSVPEARLLVMGTGPMETLVRRAAADPHSGIELVPPGGPADVADTLRRGSVFVTAPRATWKWTEQYGLAYLEAMATGLHRDDGMRHQRGGPTAERLHCQQPRGAGDGVDAIPGRRGAPPEGRCRQPLTAVAEHDLATSCAAMAAAFAQREQ